MTPAWETRWWLERAARPSHYDPYNDDDFQWIVRNSSRFDCRKLDAGFLFDTGLEVIAELDAGGPLLRLPVPTGVYQFDDCWVSLHDASHVVRVGAEDFNAPSVPYFTAYVHLNSDDDPGPDDTHSYNEDAEIWDRNSWDALVASGAQDGDYCSLVFCATTEGDDGDLEAIDVPGDAIRKSGVIRALGLLALLEEKLLRQRIVAGASITKNARRTNKELAPLLPYRIVTLNLAETRRRTKGVALHAHESPRLHWRRGHWRTLHRLSEFERRAWIKRCLVGDHDKGFVSKHYRAVWQPTVH